MASSLVQKSVLEWFERRLAEAPSHVPLMMLVGNEEGQLGLLYSQAWLDKALRNPAFGPSLEGLVQGVVRKVSPAEPIDP